MNQSIFFDIIDINWVNLGDYIVNSNLYLRINIDNNNLLSLFNILLISKKDNFNVILKINWIKKVDEKILIRLFSVNLIKNIIIDFDSIEDIKYFFSLVIILWKFKELKITYVFNFELFNPYSIFILFNEKLNFWNIKQVVLEFNKSDDLLSYFYVLNNILNLFKHIWFDKYLIKNIPNCFLLDKCKNIENNIERSINNISKDCLQCELLDSCWWISNTKLKVFPIKFNLGNANNNLLLKLSQSIIISNINYDTENKYPIDIKLIDQTFIWTKTDFFSIINSSDKDLALYIHIPFCVSKCDFCCCSSQEWVTDDLKKEYLEKLLREINLYWKNISDKNITSIFFWWWTPSYYWEDDLDKIFQVLKSNFNIVDKYTNIAFEVTESTITKKKIDFLKSMWVTNIYMWLQTADKEILKNINRVQNVDRLKELAKYIKNKWLNLSIDIVVWLRWDTLETLFNTMKVVEEIKPNSLQVCRFEIFWNITWDYKNYEPKFIEIHFNYVKKILLKLWYKQLDIYDEIFYLDKLKMSTYDIDIIKWKTDLIWFWSFAKSKIIDKLKWENKKTQDYLEWEDLLFSTKSSIDKLNIWDNDRHYIISSIETDYINREFLNWFTEFDTLEKSTDFFNNNDDKFKLDNFYINRFYSKVIWWFFFQDKYFNEIYEQWLFNLFLDSNLDFYRYIWAKLDNYDNVFPIDPILDNIPEDLKYDLWKSYLKENIDNKEVFHIDKLWMYIHIPFCTTICSFCSCKTDTDLYRIDEYLENLIDEINKYWKIFKDYKFKTIYFWWWTPGILNNEQLEKLFWALYDSFSFSNDLYISFEATPYSLNESKIKLLKQFWVKRLSIGIQSIDKDVLNNINRPQSIDYLYEIFSIIKRVGIDSLSIDFVAWLKWETIESLNKMLEFINDIKPDSVHLYQYYIDRSNSSEQYDEKRVEEIEKLYYYAKSGFVKLWYVLSNNHDSVYVLNQSTISNLHDYNYYKYNNSVLALWEHSEWHIFWKLYYKNINNWIIKWKIVDNLTEFWIFFLKKLELGIDIIEFKGIFWVDILTILTNKLSYLFYKGFISIENNIIKSNMTNHLDYISFYKIFWPENELSKLYLDFITGKKDKNDYYLFNSKPIK